MDNTYKVHEKAYRIHIDGIVQGVGFRPFVYKMAEGYNLKGWVNNSSDGVNIHVEGDLVEEFVHRLETEKPPLAVVLAVRKEKVPFGHYPDFQIVESRKAAHEDVLISPDVATCEECLQEMSNPHNRRYKYPFINCTNCGPRYSIILDRPYDRAKTTMETFDMCPDCQQEYKDPLERRFHAQPTSCYDCGPQLQLLDSSGKEVANEGIGIRLLEEGAILAVKGIGGFHLVCNGYDHEAVKRLRKSKERGAKPFALMAKNLEIAAKEVLISGLERSVLLSPAAPIVLLPQHPGRESKLSPDIAPGLHTLGIILPYTPMHHLLFEGKFDFLVMTSANLSGQPLIYANDTALESLQGIADYFLMHNRDIYHPCDDSVVQAIGKQITFHRRARGYVPLPLVMKQEEFPNPIAGLGGEMKNAFCLASGRMAFMSQYIGDMHGLENFQRFEQEFISYQKVANIYPKLIACDKHPEYSTTKMAKDLKLPTAFVQHHHGHHVTVMGEYGLTEPMLGLICDGTGYGEDGRIWGFEFLFGNAEGYERRGHLEYLPLPGGDAGAKHPLRLAYAYLQKSLTAEEWAETAPIWEQLSSQERSILDGQIKSGFQMFETSSAGRLFDAVSGLLGICRNVTYEGQAAIELESAATVWYRDQRLNTDFLDNLDVRAGDIYPISIADQGGEKILKVNLLLRRVAREYLESVAVGEIAFRFHASLARTMLETAMAIGLPNKEMVIGGGVFQNKLLTEMLLTLAAQNGIKIYYPLLLPAGDGGLALGQVLIGKKVFDRDGYTC